MQQPRKIAIIGGGPSGLFLYKRFVEAGLKYISVDIFEARDSLGNGMPYSREGANPEHVTNVSGNEIPELMLGVVEWIKEQPPKSLKKYNLELKDLHDYKVLPRLLFGHYLEAQFRLLQEEAARKGLKTRVHLNTRVLDMKDLPADNQVEIKVETGDQLRFDSVVISTGHNWPQSLEGKIPGYYDSPYPPLKLKQHFDHAVALRGSSLTAIDAVRTLARQHGKFVEHSPHDITYEPNPAFPSFKLVMHSTQGLLPAVRFHLDDPHLSKSSLLTDEEIASHIISNDGFLSLDFIFKNDFVEQFREKDPAFYTSIKDMTMEDFVETMMTMRGKADAFSFFKAEYAEARESIRSKESVQWKEMLAILSFAMNYPAKYFSAEDMQRLHEVLMPLISIVIAFVPQSSCEELIALHAAGKLTLVAVGENSEVQPQEKGGIIYQYLDGDEVEHEVYFETFVDCIGQKHLSAEDFPFQTLVQDGTISAAKLKFRSPEAGRLTKEKGNKMVTNGRDDHEFYLRVAGIAISDEFSIMDANGRANPRIYIMAVPYIGGFNPDYSGLDFSEEASTRIMDNIRKEYAKA